MQGSTPTGHFYASTTHMHLPTAEKKQKHNIIGRRSPSKELLFSYRSQKSKGRAQKANKACGSVSFSRTFLPYLSNIKHTTNYWCFLSFLLSSSHPPDRPQVTKVYCCTSKISLLVFLILLRLVHLPFIIYK